METGEFFNLKLSYSNIKELKKLSEFVSYFITESNILEKSNLVAYINKALLNVKKSKFVP